MELKEFRVLARKILNVHGFEHAAVRFDYSFMKGAWVFFPRLDVDCWKHDNGKLEKYYPQHLAEYPSVTFALEYVKQFDMSSALKVIFHELAHLKRGPCVDYNKKVHCSRFKDEMDESHDIKWMQEMWKFDYEGKPRFDKELDKMQEKVLTVAGYEKDCNNVWNPILKKQLAVIVNKWSDFGLGLIPKITFDNEVNK